MNEKHGNDTFLLVHVWIKPTCHCRLFLSNWVAAFPFFAMRGLFHLRHRDVIHFSHIVEEVVDAVAAMEAYFDLYGKGVGGVVAGAFG